VEDNGTRLAIGGIRDPFQRKSIDLFVVVHLDQNTFMSEGERGVFVLHERSMSGQGEA
jgi:hypothetical protein